MKYRSKITGIGELAFELLEENDSLIIFNDNAPEELAEISFLHTISEFQEEIAVGDSILLGDQVYTVTAVGYEALHTLRELGHCTFRFSGKDQVELPGQIELEGPGRPNMKIGDMIVIN